MCILTIDHVILKFYHYWTAINDKIISCMVRILTTKESSYHKYTYTLILYCWTLFPKRYNVTRASCVTLQMLIYKSRMMQEKCQTCIEQIINEISTKLDRSNKWRSTKCYIIFLRPT